MKVHVIGAGLAGLAAATALAERGHTVSVLEAATYAGGRCRSYYDGVLEMTLDNGNHLLLSGNRAAFAYLRRIGAEDRMAGAASARLDFFDRSEGARWTIKPNDGALPWWLLTARRRAPGAKAADHLALARLAMAHGEATVEETITCRGPLWERLAEPFLLAALNTQPKQGSAALAGAVIRESLARGGRAYRPRIATPTLAAALIDPALAFLEARGAGVRFKTPVKSLGYAGKRVNQILTAEGPIEVGPDDAVILAAPPWIATDLVPGLTAPNAFNAIVNGHFRFDPPAGLAPIVGVIGGLAQWVFAFEDRLSVTVSAAGDLADDNRQAVAAALWADVAAVHCLPAALPPWRIVKERRATFAATPAQEARRPRTATPWRNLFLAGDWTATGLPATIEGAVRSGETAARLAVI
ncbi:MAG TPA: hydroxysqualene dehydroxylase HpnE [Caulobacteraceae bacterium]|nr:hydroxysqualene dehydroxylase HpnE [Caulobacteraceae bacterium]